MLIVAPTGSTKRVTRLSTPRFSSRQRKVIGRVAADDAVPAYQAEHLREKDQQLKERDQKMKKKTPHFHFPMIDFDLLIAEALY
jgi:hypothetical protein